MSVFATDQELADNIKASIDKGYSVGSVFIDQIANGHTLPDIVEAAIKVDPKRVIEFRSIGKYLLQSGVPESAYGGASPGPSAGNTISYKALKSDNPVMEAINLFQSEGMRLRPLPNWKKGDSQMKMDIKDLSNLFDIPDKQAIDQDFWNHIARDLATNGFTAPMVIKMGKTADEKPEIYNTPERIAVASELGLTGDIPLVFIYEQGEKGSPEGDPTLSQGKVEFPTLVVNPDTGISDKEAPPLLPSPVSPPLISD